MNRQLQRLLIVWCIFLVLLSGCSKNAAVQDNSSPKDSNSVNDPAKTPAVSESQATAEPAESDTLEYARLDQLDSYSIIMTAYAKAGPAYGTKNRYEAIEHPAIKAYDVVRYFQEQGKDYIAAEENIGIGDSKWVKDYLKGWAEGTSGVGTAYRVFLTSLYYGLQKCQFEFLESVKLGDIDTRHYQFTYNDTKTLITGDVWIASMDNLPPVPVKFLGEQGALDENGHIIEDGRHIHFEFEVSDINSADEVKPPL